MPSRVIHDKTFTNITLEPPQIKEKDSLSLHQSSRYAELRCCIDIKNASKATLYIK